MADNGNRAPDAPLSTNDSQSAESKMRRALGLNSNGHTQTVQQRPEQARQRHRFVQDGGVPVVVLNQRPEESSVLKERIAELERQLENERAMHAAARRAAQEAQAAAQAIETRLVHQDLAHQDALAQERRAVAAAQQALAEALAAVRRPRATAPSEPAAASPTESAVPSPAHAAPQSAVQPAAEIVPKKRGRPRTRPLPEPKPVRWWTPSFRAKTKA